MKCDDLENKDYNNGMTAYELMEENGLVNTAKTVKDAIAELKQKLDKAIAERDGNQVCIDALKAEINRKEAVGQRWFEQCMEARTENVRLKRALWLARANMARGLAEMCEHQFDCCGVSRSRFLVGWDKKSKPKRMTTTEWGELWRKVEQKCRAEAEQYK